MNGFDSGTLIERISEASSPDSRFAALTQGLSSLGLDIVNYGFFDPGAARLAHADIQFLTTMRDDWMSHYHDCGLSRTDSHVVRLRERRITPYFWGESVMKRIDAEGRSTALEAAEAGLRSAIVVPLTSPLDPFSPVAGMAMGCSMGEAEFGKISREHGATLIGIAHLFHYASIRQVWRDRAGGKPLSPRERDCLQYLSEGQRQAAIAERMGLACVTVELHLRRARAKLGARTLNEAVARALLYGEIAGPD